MTANPELLNRITVQEQRSFTASQSFETCASQWSTS